MTSSTEPTMIVLTLSKVERLAGSSDLDGGSGGHDEAFGASSSIGLGGTYQVSHGE